MNCIRHILLATLMLLAAMVPAVEPQAVTGNQHALYLADDGTVWAWGRNSEGQLGLGDTTPRLEPVQVPGLSNIIQVSAGLYHSMALSADGTVYVWGYNVFGQIGNGSSGTNVPSPYTLGLSNVKQIAAGAYHCLALLTDGTARGWGYNGTGCVGNNSTTSPVTSPTTVSTGVKFRAICGGGLHSLAIRDDGTAWAWGWDLYGQLGNDATLANQSAPVQVSGLTNVMSLGAGYNFSMVVTATGSAYVWGNARFGQLGNGTSGVDINGDDIYQPTPISAPGAVCSRPATGYQSVMLLRSNGYPSFWGANGSGQCRKDPATNPVTTAHSPGVPVRTASTGFGNFFVAINGDGTVIAWGDNGSGQLGINATSPASSSTPLTVHATWPVSKPMAVARGQYNAAALKSDGTVWTWGYGANGQLGNGSTSSSTTPVQASVVSGVTTLAAGGDFGDHLAARTYLGQVYAWGRNDYGQTGDTTNTTPRATPAAVSITTIRDIAVGDHHTLALDSSGYVRAWGRDGSGQLGNDASYTDSYSPVLVSNTNVNNIIQVAAGGHFGAALRADGTVWTWGADSTGQLGNDGSYVNQPTPVQVSGLTGVVQICAGSYHMLALKSDGTVVAWGTNSSGQLGDTTTTTAPTPVTVAGEILGSLGSVRSLAAGSTHSFAVKGNGDVRAWGSDSSGELGNNGSTALSRPTDIDLGGLVCGLEAGYTGSVALSANGMVQAWGYNGMGQIGNGTSTNSLVAMNTTSAWLPIVTVDGAASDLIAKEDGPDTGSVRMNRTGSTAGSLTVSYGTAFGSATAGSDYSVSGTVTIPWSQSGAGAIVTPIDDAIAENSETVQVDVAANANVYTIGATTYATVAITDNDAAGITVTPTGLSTSEAGTGAAFTITLTSQPTANVTVGLTNNDTTEGSLSTTSVTLTSANWNTGVSVTVTGVDDSVDDGDVVYSIITNAAVSSDSFYNGLNAADVTVTNADNDTAGFDKLVVNGTPTEAVGGAAAVVFTSFTSASKTLVLPVAVDVSALRMGQTVLFLDGVNKGLISTIVSLTSGGSFHTLVLADALGGNDATGTSRLSFIPCIGLRLTSEPTANVTVGVSSGDTGKMAVGPTTLTFSATNWNSYQYVSCYGIDNFLDDGDVATTVYFANAVSSDVGYSGAKIGSSLVTVADDDVSDLWVSTTSLAVTENSPGVAYSVKLTCKPSGQVTVTVTPGALVTADKATLTFGPLTWNVPQTVTVTAVDDPDINGTRTTSITNVVSATGDANFTGAASDPITVSVANEDAPGLVVTPTTTALNRLTVTENTSVVVGVRLASRPQSGTSVRMVFALSAGATGHDTISNNDLTWGYADWNTVKYVTISADDDTDSPANELFTVDGTVTTTGGSDDPNFYTFTGSWPQAQTNLAYLKNIDDDVPGISLSAAVNPLSVSEVGGSATARIRLTTSPGVGNVVAVALSGTGVTVSPSIVFFDNTTFSTPVDLAISAVGDAIYEGPHAGTLTASVTYSSNTTDYPLTMSSGLVVQITDDDAVGVSVSPVAGLLCAEDGSGSVFTVRLTSQPTGTVRVVFASGNTDEAQVSTASQTGGGSSGSTHWIDFTANDWNQTRSVTVSGVDDDLVDEDQPFSIAVTIDGANTTDTSGYAALDPADVQGSTIDDDTVGVQLLANNTDTTPVGTLALTEVSGVSHSATYYISLASEPTDQVTVTLYPDSQIGVSPETLVFTTTNWQTPQAVTVTAVDDNIAEGASHIGSITASATGGGYTGVGIGEVRATLTDNDAAGITVAAISGPVAESRAALVGPWLTFSNAATSDSTVEVTSAANLAPGMWLRFTSGASGGNNGNYAYIIAINGTTLTVAAELTTDTNVAADVFMTTVTATSVSGTTMSLPLTGGLVEGQFLQFIGGTNKGRTAQITAIDTGTNTITINPSVASDTNAEVAFFAALRVSLASQPLAPVEISLVSSDVGEAEVFPNIIVFTPQNWNLSQVIAVTGVDDAFDDGDQTVDLEFATATSTDGNYSGLSLPNRTVGVLDDDEYGIVLSVASVSVSEDGGTATVTVSLASQPTADVTVTLTSSTTSATLDVSEMTFSTSTWKTPQTVTITGQDNGTDPGGSGISMSVSLTAASTDTTYQAATASLAVTVTAANAIPTIDAIADQETTQQNSQIVVPLTGIGSGQSGENQTLTVTATASPTTLLGTPAVSYTSPDATGSITIPLVSGAFGAGTVTVTVTDDTGIDGTVHSIQKSFSVTVAAVVIDLNGSDMGVDGTGVTFNEDATGIALAGVAALTDSQGNDLTMLTATLATAPDGAEEELAVDVGETDLTASYDATTRTLTISGSASAAIYQQVVRTLTYRHTGQNPTAGARTVTLTGTDQNDVTSLPATVTVTVVPVNDAPVIGGSGTFSVSSQQTLVIDTGILTVTDVDSQSSSLSVTAVTIPGEGTLLLDGVALETGASITLAQIAAGALAYQHTSTTLSNDVFAVRASDGSTTSALSLVTITVLGIRAPTMAATTVAVAGNHPRTVTLPISDPNGLTVTMVLSSSAPPAKGVVAVGGAGTNRITYTPDIDATGDDAFGLTLTNTNNESATVTVNVHITDPGEDQPLITSLPPVEVVASERFYYEPIATNPLGGTLTWELDSTPAGAVFGSGTGTINWPSVPMPSDGSGYHRLDLVAIDDTNHRVAWQVIWLKVRATAATVAN